MEEGRIPDGGDPQALGEELPYNTGDGEGEREPRRTGTLGVYPYMNQVL